MKKVYYYLILIFSIIIVTLAAGELTIRGYLFFHKDRISTLMSDIFFSQYHLINYKIKSINMYFLKKNFSTVIYANGLVWHHETDKYGFRNRGHNAEKSDVLLIGDSFIYGHGVEINQTVTEYLRNNHGIYAYNMGRSSDCLYQSYVLLRTYYDLFKPKKVIIFPFFNDIDDLLALRSEKQLTDLPEITAYNYSEILDETLKNDGGIPEKARMIRYKSYLYRLYKAKEIVFKSLLTSGGHKHEVDLRDLSISVYSRPNYQLIEGYYLSILKDIKRLCSKYNTEVYLVNIYPQIEGRDLHLKKAIEDFDKFMQHVAMKSNINYFDTKILFNNEPEYYIPIDKHLSDKGHKKLAAFIAQILEKH